MARPRQFDEEDVLERAMHAFWSHGYERTSLDDLLECTQLSKSSLYGAFGDKHSLFIRALERYSLSQQRLAADALGGAEKLRPRLHALLSAVAAESADPDSPGCLMLSAIADLGSTDPDVRQVSRANGRALCRAFESAIALAQQRGEVPAAVDAPDCAAFIFGSIAGFRIQGRSGVPKRSLLRQVDVVLRSLDG
jgi:TetR/AcrR family transcriptional regulator, transcriptional repressor for nem operon